MKSIATINFKGGVGKSTVTWLLAKYAAEKMNKKVLVVDIDSQMSLTLAVQLEDVKGTLNKDFERWYDQHKQSHKTLFDALTTFEKGNGNHGEFSINSSIIYRMTENLHFIPSTTDLYWLEFDLCDKEKIKQFFGTFLRKMEHTLNFNYDFIFFDCPPNFSALSYSVLSSVNLILIPVNPDVLAAKSINLLIEGFSKRIDPWQNPKIAVFMNKAKTQREYLTIESKKYMEDLKKVKFVIGPKGINIDVFDTFIPEKSDIKKAIAEAHFPLDYIDSFHDLWFKLDKFIEV